MSFHALGSRLSTSNRPKRTRSDPGVRSEGKVIEEKTALRDKKWRGNKNSCRKCQDAVLKSEHLTLPHRGRAWRPEDQNIQGSSWVGGKLGQC